MGTTYRFLSSVEESEAVLTWFRSRPANPIELRRDNGLLFFFSDFGPLHSEVSKSPLVAVLPPIRVRGALTTVGEVHFLSTPLKAFPELKVISSDFQKWLRQYACVWSNRHSGAQEWDYYLEGSIRNFDTDVFAMPAGAEALKRGDYFIAHDDLNRNLSALLRTLELRGVTVLNSDGMDG